MFQSFKLYVQYNALYRISVVVAFIAVQLKFLIKSSFL